jgi:hypothetical protein
MTHLGVQFMVLQWILHDFQVLDTKFPQSLCTMLEIGCTMTSKCVQSTCTLLFHV